MNKLKKYSYIILMVLVTLITSIVAAVNFPTTFPFQHNLDGIFYTGYKWELFILPILMIVVYFLLDWLEAFLDHDANILSAFVVKMFKLIMPIIGMYINSSYIFHSMVKLDMITSHQMNQYGYYFYLILSIVMLLVGIGLFIKSNKPIISGLFCISACLGLIILFSHCMTRYWILVLYIAIFILSEIIDQDYYYEEY